jgi:hypothetical protein
MRQLVKIWRTLASFVRRHALTRASTEEAIDEVRQGSLAPLAAFVAGVLAAGLLLFWDALVGVIAVDEKAWGEAGAFLENPETLVWITLLCAQAGVWAIAAGVSRGTLAALAEGTSWPVAVAGLLFIALLVAPVVIVPPLTSGPATPLPGHRYKITAFIVLAFVAAAPWIIATWRTGTLARRFTEKARADATGWVAELAGAVKPAAAHPFDGYHRLRELLGHAVTILSVIVAGITLTTGALRLAVTSSDKHADFPVASVLVYGGFFSLLLALVYLPVQLRLLELGRHLRDWAAPVTARDEWHGERFKRRGDAETQLGLTAGPVASMQAGLAILAPLATGLVGALLSSD